MKNSSLHEVVQENGITVIKDSADTAFAEISVCETNCLLKMYKDGESKADTTIISCQTDNDTKICKNELIRFILSGDPDSLNWYIGMDFEDIHNFCSAAKRLQFIYFEEDISAVNNIAEQINALFPNTGDLLIYVQGSDCGIGARLFDRLPFSRWIQFSLDETLNTNIKVSIWYNPATAKE
ncbi:MAG: hypothetical protein IJW29_04035 [Clostridia bacterium]|nr:hypothetical protein [Clostridia bacterium]